MLLIVLALVVATWLGVVTAVIAVCVASARTDRVLASGARREGSAPPAQRLRGIA